MAKDRPLTPPPSPQSSPPTKASADVPAYRRCPLCFNGSGGVGTCYSSQGGTRYYKCDQCAHTWTARVTPDQIVIETRKVEISER